VVENGKIRKIKLEEALNYYASYKKTDKKLSFEIREFDRVTEGIKRAKKLVIKNGDKIDENEILIFGVVKRNAYSYSHASFITHIVKNWFNEENFREKIIIACESTRWQDGESFLNSDKKACDEYFNKLIREIIKNLKEIGKQSIVFADIEGRNIATYPRKLFELEKTMIEQPLIFNSSNEYSVEKMWKIFPFIILRADVSFASAIRSLLNEYKKAKKLIVIIGAGHVEGTIKALQEGIEVTKKHGLFMNYVVKDQEEVKVLSYL